jgi:hypothetical protein
MTTTQPISYGQLFTVYPKVNLDRQLIEVAVVTEQQGVSFRTGYVDYREDDFTDKIETPELVIKCKTNREQTVLERVVLLSKHRAPFVLNVSVKSYPRPDASVNQKYLQAMNEPGNPIQRLYTLLEQNPAEFPMIPADLIGGKLTHSQYDITKDGLVDLRSRVTHIINKPAAL